MTPLCTYGRTKVAAEAAILATTAQALVIRTSAFFGPWDEYNFITQTIAALRRGDQIRAVRNVRVSPTYVPHLVHAMLDLLIDGATGLWHLANEGAVSWADLAHSAAARAGLDRSLVRSVPAAGMDWRAPRPAHNALGSERGRLMPRLADALDEYFAAVA